jgi:CRP-like cAMP-binding protein
MQEAAEGQVGQIELFMNNVTLLKDLKREQRLRLVDAFTEESFPAESVIIKEGDAGDKFYIIKT